MLPSARPSVKCVKPQEWNIGAAMWIGRSLRSGSFESSVASGASESGEPRWAPFGVPSCPR